MEVTKRLEMAIIVIETERKKCDNCKKYMTPKIEKTSLYTRLCCPYCNTTVEIIRRERK